MMIGDLARVAIAQETLAEPEQPRARIDLEGKPLISGVEFGENPNLRFTNFFYALKYKPSVSTIKSKKNPFVISADIIMPRGSIRVSDWNGLVELAKDRADLAWLIKYTNICEDMFAIAAYNIHMHVPIAFDAVKYYKDLRAQCGDKAIYKAPDVAEREYLRYAAWMKKYNKEIPTYGFKGLD